MSTAPSLHRVFRVASEWELMLYALDQSEGVLTDETEAELSRLTEHATPAVIDEACSAIKSLDAEAEVIAAEMDRLRRRKQSAEDQSERIRGAIGLCLDAAGVKSVKGERYTAIRTAPRERVEIQNIARIPDVFRIPQPDKIDVAGIGRAMKANADVPGAALVRGLPGLMVR